MIFQKTKAAINNRQPIEKPEKNISLIFEKHNQSLHRFLLSMLHSEQDAQDIAQEAYVRLLRLDEPNAVSHLKAFLFKTAERLAIDRLRQRQRKDYKHNEIEDSTLQVDISDLPEQQIDEQQRYQHLPEVLNELPPKCRLAFISYTIDGLNYSQIASNMRLTESMVRKYVLRALRHIQDRIGNA